MNGKERRRYSKNYEAVNKRFRRKYYAPIYGAIKHLSSSLISDIREKGISVAASNLSMVLINDKLTAPIMGIYKEVGLYHAKINYRTIRNEVNRKGLGQSDGWIQEVIELLKRTLLDFAVVRPTETFRNHLLKILSDSLIAEMSVDEVVKILADDNFSKYQAERIVRTEVGRAANTGVQVAASSFPYEMSKEWVSFQDVRTRGIHPKDRKDHFHLDGVVVDYNEPFVDPISGERIMYPQAPKGSAAMVINCRCTWAVIPKRDENDNLIKRGNYIPKESRD